MFSPSERRRLLVMGTVFVLVLSALVWNRVASRAEKAVPEVRPEIGEALVTPEPRADRYRELAKDATLEQRSVIETDALAVALDDASRYAPAHFTAMRGVELDAALRAELASASDASRGKLLLARGTIEQLVGYPAGAGLGEHHRGRLRLDDGGTAFFVASTFGDLDLGIGDYARIDGFFLKNHAESAPSGWLEGPLIVGPRVVRSQPELPPVTTLSPADFAAVEDDAPDYRAMHDGVREYWTLVRYVERTDPGLVDWDSAPLLDRETLQRLVREPHAFRGMPMRLPPCRIQGIWTQPQSENPARIEQLTEGWCGTLAWEDPASAVLRPVRFVSPRPNPGLQGPRSVTQPGSEMTADGYFLRMIRYEAAGAGMQVAPLFVLADMRPWSPPKDLAMSQVLWAAGLGSLAMVVVIAFLLRRDKRQSAAFSAEMVRRRRARRVQEA